MSEPAATEGAGEEAIPAEDAEGATEVSAEATSTDAPGEEAPASSDSSS
jgi:hypothetical protein